MNTLLNHPLAKQVLEWASAKELPPTPTEYLCPTRDVFRARADSLIIRLRHTGIPEDQQVILDSVLSEIGNNAFDHNLGNLKDLPGVFFGSADSKQPFVVLADRGLGIRTTLSRVRHDLTSDAMALKTAFTERISGRAPEKRGNGLKFVRYILLSDGLDLWFGSGNASYSVLQKNECWEDIRSTIPGCVALITSSHP